MKRRSILASLGLLFSRGRGQGASQGPHHGFQQPDAKNFPDLFCWRDVCQVYLLRDGDEALLINLGDGSILDHLGKIGVKRVSWLLLTDHHREQVQGISRLDRNLTKIAAPKAEQSLLKNPTSYRKWKASLGDSHSVHGASYVRPPRVAVTLDRALNEDEHFVWKSHKLKCLATPGHSPGGMSFELKTDQRTALFIGGVMHDGARMSNWFDTEWDYGFAKGIDALIATSKKLQKRKADLALPLHGPTISNPQEQFPLYHQRLVGFRKPFLRGYPVFDSTKEDSDPISKPTAVPNLHRVTPHLYKLSHKFAGKNFAMIISDNGKGLIIDCGLFRTEVLDQIIEDSKKHLGLKQVEALWVTHMHGDHFLLGPHLKEKHGVETWSMDRVADLCEHPSRYDYSAMISAYGEGIEGMKIDKTFRSGDTIKWEGYNFHVDWMPGQTEFASCLWLELDGQRVAFTGDNLFANPRKESQDGHECVMARNSGIIGEGYLQAAKYLRKLKPDLLMGGHSWVMPKPAALIGRYHAWAEEMIARFEEMLPEKNYEYLFDPYWVSAYPYRVDLSKGREAVVEVTIRNFQNKPQRHEIELKLPPGVTAEPKILTGTITAQSRETYPVKLTFNGKQDSQDLQIATFDITLDDERHGELFDFLIKMSQTALPEK
ncbi:MAG: MBL fold metallo-hydrolase [Akkermansiaceae bacterium]